MTSTTLACTAPFPVCPACGQGAPLPSFATGHECEISCSCGHEFPFSGQCGQTGANMVTVVHHLTEVDGWWRLGVRVLCHGHAHILTSHRLGHVTSLS